MIDGGATETGPDVEELLGDEKTQASGLITDAHMMQLGFVAACSNGMDAALGTLLVELVNSPVAHGILLGQNFSTTAQSVIVVADTMPSDWPLRLDIQSVVKTAKALYEQRNGAVHGLWTVPGTAGGDIATYTVKRWGKTAKHPWSADDLRSLGSQMLAATFELFQLTERVQQAQGRTPTLSALMDLARMAVDADHQTRVEILARARTIVTDLAAETEPDPA